MNLVGAYAQFVASLRYALFWVALVIAVICTIDWAVRTRRINPFSRVARFFRANIDPLLAPIERVIVRSGGVPSSAAWWGLFAFVVFAIGLVYVLQFGENLLFQVAVMSRDPGSAWRIIASWAVSLLVLALWVRVLSSWLSVSPYSRWVRWAYLLTDWMIQPLSRVVPRIGAFDITPLVAWFLLSLLRGVLLG